MAEPDPMELLADAFDGEPSPFGPRGLLVLRARPSRAFARDALVCEQGSKPLHAALDAEGREVHAELPADLAEFPAAAVCLTRARAENRANLARAWAKTAEGGRLFVSGAKTDGIESLQKALRKEGLEVEAAPRRHGRVLSLVRQGEAPALFAQWLEEAAAAPRVHGLGRDFVTAAGVFSWDKVDPGSALLAEALPPLKGAVADLGAGWGFLSARILESADVASLDLVEAEHAALACAQANLSDPRARFHWADVRAMPLPRASHETVVANPPFHDGREVSLALGTAFLEAAARLLKPSGRLWLVANRTLPYEKVLERAFVEWSEVGGDGAYKLLCAARPRPPAARGRQAR
ncbi:class I SAM-dependent methyltransferase [Albimonas pacifica]|uniref:16S rRNA m(2)G 1207 methyltransferase n=1 Tax=Albimonas pacifica TaxID=1114924 RepID=A0A1I3GN15_9RHOB|nr:class I SAM-dependent methyltransferase [Albimonas pacifica]SFI24898.1 16S rRNA m(2)G 1207 methyltransferase [Albimonas pacifica]